MVWLTYLKIPPNNEVPSKKKLWRESKNSGREKSGTTKTRPSF